MSLPSARPSGVGETVESQLAAIHGVSIKPNELMSAHTSMGVGGAARWFVTVEDRSALIKVLEILRAADARWMMLGGGSNTLFDDAGYDGIVVHLGKGFRAIEAGPEPDQVTAGAGATLSAIMNFAKRRALAGMEFAAGIPGVLGGALAGNAGAAGGDICSLADAVEVVDAKGNVVTRKRGEFCFAYRYSQLRDDVVLGATLRLRPDAPEAIDARIQQSLSKRFEQPVGERSAGCMFKNPPGGVAGRLIDETGLKGLSLGKVSVSDKHANFMINEGGASSKEIVQLMRDVQAKVKEKTGVELEVEVRIIEK